MYNDIYELWDGNKLQFTLKKICNILEIEVPFALKSKENIVLEEVGYNTLTDKGLKCSITSICFDVWPSPDSYKRLLEYTKKGGGCSVFN